LQYSKLLGKMVDANATVPGGAAAEYIFAVWNLVIRPPRSSYNPAMLGPSEFKVRGVRATRRDLRLKTDRGGHLECSHFTPWQAKGKEMQKIPVVIYLHGNSSSRLEAGNLVQLFLEQHISVFCYDAAGCGLSDGDYVSLGWHERDDLANVISHLRSSPFCGPIGLWGRSMGSVTALMHAYRDPSLGAVLLDSPFSSLRALIQDIAQGDRSLFRIPTFLLEGALAVIRMRVKTLAGFDIEDIVPTDHVGKSYVPAFFMHGSDDTFILPKHSQDLYNNYAGDKEYHMVDGDHNSERSSEVIAQGVDFFCRAFRSNEMDLTVPSHALDAELIVPQEDTLPHRVPSMPKPVPLLSNVVRKASACRARASPATVHWVCDETMQFKHLNAGPSGRMGTSVGASDIISQSVAAHGGA